MWVALHSVYPVRVPIGEMREQAPSQEELTEIIYHDAVEYYEQREAGWGEELTRNIERWITLQVTDTRWREHLDNMDYMRQGIGLRGYAQKDPLVEYRREGQEMFDEMEFLIEQEVVRALMHAEVQVEDKPAVPARDRASAGQPQLRARAARPRAAGGRGEQRRRRRAVRGSLPGGRAAPRRPGEEPAATIRAGAAAARSTSAATGRSAMARRRRGLGLPRS